MHLPLLQVGSQGRNGAHGSSVHGGEGMTHGIRMAFLRVHGHMGTWRYNPLSGPPLHVFPPPSLPTDCEGPGGAGLRARPPPGQGCGHLRRRRIAPPRHRLRTLFVQVRALPSLLSRGRVPIAPRSPKWPRSRHLTLPKHLFSVTSTLAPLPSRPLRFLPPAQPR